MSEYTQQAETFVTKHELEFRAVLVGDDCPLFCEDAQKQNAMDQVNVYPRKTHIHGKHYRCTFSRKGKGHFTVEFWNSYHDEEFNACKRHQDGVPDGVYMKHGFRDSAIGWLAKMKEPKRVPTAYDVLSCLQKSDPETFHDFANEFGYDEDSRKAEEIYRAVVKEWRNVERFFTAEEITELQEIN